MPGDTYTGNFQNIIHGTSPQKVGLVGKGSSRLEGWCMRTHLREKDFILRVLLNHVRGPTSFISIRTVRDVVSPTFRECCEKLGLVETDNSLDNALSEAVTFQMLRALRRMFATIIVYCEYTNICALWDKHYESMAEDYRHVHGSSSIVEQFVLRDIADILSSMGKDIRNYGLAPMQQSGKTF